MRILLAGILGGIAMFIWTSIAHMALPLGKLGLVKFRMNQQCSARCRATRHRVQHRSAPGNSGDLAIGTDADWELCWPSRFRSHCRNSGLDNNQRFVLELVRLPWRLHRQLYTDRDGRFRSRWSCCRAGAAKAQSGRSETHVRQSRDQLINA